MRGGAIVQYSFSQIYIAHGARPELELGYSTVSAKATATVNSSQIA